MKPILTRAMNPAIGGASLLAGIALTLARGGSVGKAGRLFWQMTA